MDSEAEFHLTRYRPSDRERIFEMIRASNSSHASIIIRDWDWRYDSNPFNAEAERERRLYSSDVAAYLRKVYSSQRTERFNQRWPIEPDDTTDCSVNRPHMVLMKNRAGRIVALVAGIPQQFSVGGCERWATIEALFTVHPDYRNRKLSQPIGHRIRSDNLMLFGWANALSSRIQAKWRTAAASAKYGRLQQELPMVRLIKPIDGRALARLASNNSLLAAAAGILIGGWRFAGSVRPWSTPPTEVRVVEIDLFDTRFDDLYNRARESSPVMTVRRASYLNWRFFRRPATSYTVLAAIQDSKVVGYLVARVSDHLGTRCGFLIDSLTEPGHETVFSLLLQDMERRLCAGGVAAIVCSASSSWYRKGLQKSGYYPVLFGENQRLAAVLNSDDPALRPFRDVERWFVTSGDGNLEMSF